MKARRRLPERRKVDNIPRSWVPPAAPAPRVSTMCSSSTVKVTLAIFSAVGLFLAIFSNPETWKIGVDLIDSLTPQNATSVETAVKLRIHDSPLGAQTQDLRDHLATAHQAMEEFRGALHDPVWDSLAGKHASYLASPERGGDQAMRQQFEVVTRALQNMSSKRVDSLDQHRQRYCVEAFTAIYKARKSIKRIRYILSDDNRQQASRDEVCRLSREHYNLVWILHPKHALVFNAMYDLLTAATQLAEGVDTFLNDRSYCPPTPPTAPFGPQGECLLDLPSWTKSVPWTLVEFVYKDELAKQQLDCSLATRQKEWEQRNGKKCRDEDRITFNKLVQSHSFKNFSTATDDMIEILDEESKKVLKSVQDAWTTLRRYFDRFKFMRLFDTQTHQRWQCSEWQELHQRELAADLEHDQRMDGLDRGDEIQPDFWGAHLLNRSNMELEGYFRKPEAVVKVFEMLLNATFSNGC